MPKITRLAAITLAALSTLTTVSRDTGWPTYPVGNLNRSELERSFANPADVQTSCYWYWISGNVSPEGVVEDVRAMKRAGINRAFMGFQGLAPNEAAHGPVYIQTPEWYECVRNAMRTATEEGVEIGVFNCPGWSQSGGPWVRPEESQRFLAFADTVVKVGENPLKIRLARPDNYLSDMAVIARPADDYRSVSAQVDGNVGSLPVDAPGLTLRSVVLTTDGPVRGEFTISAYIGGEWKPVKTFRADRTNMNIEVGYDPTAPTVASVTPVKADKFRMDYKVNANVDNAVITLSERPMLEAWPDKILSKMYQQPLPFWEQYKWEPCVSDGATVYTSEKKIIDLTGNLDGDMLSATLPSGEWVISRAYLAPTGVPNAPALDGDGKGLEIDRWNPDVLEKHYDSFIRDIQRHVPADERKSWRIIVSDSYERATQNAGDDFKEYFISHFGYDPTPYLPVYQGVIIGSPEVSDRFLWDMRRMLADRLAYDHIGGLRKLANKDGYKLWLEPYGHWGYPGEFLMYGGQSDEVSGEFWSEGSLGDIENRVASSVAHTYGKGRCSAESFTVGGPEYTRSPRTYKARGDRFFAEGINSTLLHLFVSQPDSVSLPGMNCPFGNEFNRKNTWYDQLYQFTDYLKRSNLLLQQGNYVADVAYFIGEDAPVMTGKRSPEIPAGFQYDWINAEIIENTLSASADHTLSLPHGTAYRVLVLPPLKTMRPELLSAIERLINDGAIVLGARPETSPSLQNYPQCDVAVKETADRLWGAVPAAKQKRQIGKGVLYTGYELPEVFEEIGLKPDFVKNTGAKIDYAHTVSPERDIYFVANQSWEPQAFSAAFRDAFGRQPELWDAVKASHRDLPEYASADGYTTVPLQLAPMESVFIVFEKDAVKTDGKNYPERTLITSLPDGWDINLCSMFGEQSNIKDAATGDLSLSSDDAVKHFAGTMTYTNTFKMPKLSKGKRVELNLGEVREMAEVYVNGQKAGGVWTAPYTLDITDFVKKGRNKITVKVVNNWNNRLIGDAQKPAEQRRTSYPYHYLTPQSPLQPAGMLGPVEIYQY